MDARMTGADGLLARNMLAALVFGAAFMAPFAASALSYSAKPISLVVVDAETRQPIEGVIALVVWKLQNTDGGGGGFWVFEEAVGDTQGRVMFPGWGPKVVPKTSIGELNLRLGPDQPTIYLFKSGYPFGVFYNEWESWMLGNTAWTGDLVRTSIWDAKTVEIRKFDGLVQNYVDSLARGAVGLPLQGCQWVKVPQFTSALITAQGDRTSKYLGLPTIKGLEANAENYPECSMPRQILAPYLK